MQDIDMTTEELLCELRELRSQIDGFDSALKLSKSYESIFREMIDREGEAVFVVQDGRIKFANPAYVKLTGYKLDETLVHNVIESLVHPDDREMVSQYHTRRLQGDTLNFHYNFRIICKQGFQKWVEMNSSLIMWDGKAAALCFANDITERKEAQESMKDSHDLIKVIIDSLPVGLLYLDSLERIVFANKKFGAWWGKPGVNLSGHMVDNILGDDYTEIRNRLRTALAGQEIFHEAQVRGKDGATREMVISYAPHIVGNGQVKGVACLIQDITPLKQVERELRKNKERLEIALEAGAVGLWDWDLKTGRPVGGKWTTRMRQTLGFEAEPWPDIRSWKSAVHPDDWQMVSKALNDHLTGQVPFFEAEFRMRGVSDEWKYYLS
ncbi:MAG: PAS domain S-box protein, partial [Desulfomonilaceae bacterium]